MGKLHPLSGIYSCILSCMQTNIRNIYYGPGTGNTALSKMGIPALTDLTFEKEKKTRSKETAEQTG